MEATGDLEMEKITIYSSGPNSKQWMSLLEVDQSHMEITLDQAHFFSFQYNTSDKISFQSSFRNGQ
jgi:hypothetical protein